jgi:hypothetical protein
MTEPAASVRKRRVFQLLHEGRFAGKSLMILVAAKRWTPLQAGKGITAAIQISIISECRALLERGVTVHSGDMGYTIGPFAGSARCPGRCVNPRTND